MALASARAGLSGGFSLVSKLDVCAFFLSIVTCDLSRWLRGDDVKTGFRQFAEASRETGLASLTGDERADDNPSTRRSVAVLKQALHKELLSTGKLPGTRTAARGARLEQPRPVARHVLDRSHG